jgi:hypothetical protein
MNVSKVFSLIAISFTCYMYSYAQDTPCDSCEHHASIFRYTLNFCDGSASLSGRYLEKNCLKTGSSEEYVIKLLGCNDTSGGVVHRVTKEMRPNPFFGAAADCDYYIPYVIHQYCDEDKNLISFPSSQIWLFFKDGILVGISQKSYG